MKLTLVAALCATVCAGAGAAFAQDDDDWEFQHEPSLNQMVAAVRYDAGVAIVVQCRDNALSAALIGMPQGPGGFALQATRTDGRSDLQTWAPGPAPGIYLSTVPARDIRFMRGGGLYAVRTAEGAPRALRTDFDLPTQSANLDRVLTACGWGLTDDRDALARADGLVSLGDPEGSRAREPRRPSRPRAGGGGRPSRPEPAPVGPPVQPPAEGQVSCVVRNLRLTECRRDHPLRAANAGPTGDRLLRFLESVPLSASDGAVVEGKVLYPGAGVALIQVTREQIL